MVAADWYGVDPNNGLSPRGLRLGPALDGLVEHGAAIVELMIKRLAKGHLDPDDRKLGSKLWSQNLDAEKSATA